MKKLAFSLAAMATAAIAPAVSAQTVTIPITITSGSGMFGDGNVTCATGVTAPCPFSDTFTFTTPTGYNLTSASIISSQVGAPGSAGAIASNIDFTTVTLNGVNFDTVLTGYTELRQLLNLSITSGSTNTIVVSGVSGGNGSYAGSLVFAAAAVPEPAAWALMILGFGVVGYALRRRPSVHFAQA